MSGHRISREIEPIVDAFREVLGYAHAYRSGAPAGPEYGWAIRNFNEVCEDVAADQAASRPVSVTADQEDKR